MKILPQNFRDYRSMFKHEFQGGQAFEIFSRFSYLISHGKNNPNHWKISKSVKKVYAQDLRGFSFQFESITNSLDGKISLPKNEKHTVELFQPVLLLQLCLPTRGILSIECCLTDTNNNHRRLFISNLIREIKITALHVSLPLPILSSNGWMNLAIDLAGMVTLTYIAIRKFSWLLVFLSFVNNCQWYISFKENYDVKKVTN
jgi:hypothetical protein